MSIELTCVIAAFFPEAIARRERRHHDRSRFIAPKRLSLSNDLRVRQSRQTHGSNYFVAGFEHAVNELLSRYGLFALFLLLALEEFGLWLPLPGDLLIVYFGFQAVHSKHPLFAAAAVIGTVVAAALTGSTALFLLISHYRWIVRKLGPIIHLDEARLEQMESWLGRRGAPIIVVARLIPGLRIATTVVSATFGIRLTVFMRAVAVSALIWGSLYFAIGAAGGTLFGTAEHFARTEFSRWLLPIIAVAAIAAIIVRFWQPFWSRVRKNSRWPVNEPPS
jgi:membrane protein DedA with SNARE-associated domain